MNYLENVLMLSLPKRSKKLRRRREPLWGRRLLGANSRPVVRCVAVGAASGASAFPVSLYHQTDLVYLPRTRHSVSSSSLSWVDTGCCYARTLVSSVRAFSQLVGKDFIRNEVRHSQLHGLCKLRARDRSRAVLYEVRSRVRKRFTSYCCFES